MSQRTLRLTVVVLTAALLLSLTAMAFAAAPQGPAPGAPKAGGGKCGRRGGHIRAVAEHLGVTPEVVMGELKQGKTLAQIATAHGKTRESLRTALIAAEEQRLAKMAQSGLKLTTDEVKVLKGIMTRKVDLLLDKQWQGPKGD